MKLGALGAIGLGVLVGACELPPLKLVYEVSSGLQGCGAESCSGVLLGCDAVLHVRIADPATPTQSLASLCRPIEPNGNRNLCAIASIDLKDQDDNDIILPAETLEVQVLIWPRQAVSMDPMTGELDCTMIYGAPTVVGFNAQNFPKETTPSPALGGRAFYHRGDSETVVTLGCSDLASVNTCMGSGTDVTATVNEFDRPSASVPAVDAREDLLVRTGEPQSIPGIPGVERFILSTQQSSELRLVDPSTEVPSWFAALAGVTFEATACIEVIEPLGQSTSSVHCRARGSDQALTLDGFRLTKARLDKIKGALGLGDFPGAGLTVGLVVDERDVPVAGLAVTADASGVLYLDDAGEAIVPGATETAASGLFVAQQSPYGTMFSVQPPGAPAVAEIGGRIDGKATIVVLRVAPAIF